jgi:hypothetical protein
MELKDIQLKDAINTVLDLARQNVIDERDNKEEHDRQKLCIIKVQLHLDFMKAYTNRF